jgi:hypothetical protein
MDRDLKSMIPTTVNSNLTNLSSKFPNLESNKKPFFMNFGEGPHAVHDAAKWLAMRLGSIHFEQSGTISRPGQDHHQQQTPPV